MVRPCDLMDSGENVGDEFSEALGVLLWMHRGYLRAGLDNAQAYHHSKWDDCMHMIIMNNIDRDSTPINPQQVSSSLVFFSA